MGKDSHAKNARQMVVVHTPTLTAATSIQNYVNKDVVCVQKRLSQHKQAMKLELAGIANIQVLTPPTNEGR